MNKAEVPPLMSVACKVLRVGQIALVSFETLPEARFFRNSYIFLASGSLNTQTETFVLMHPQTTDHF